MIMANFLKARKSVRDFKNKEISVEKLENVNEMLENLVEDDELKKNVVFKLFENGKFIYDSLKGVSGYSGVMIESPHYIAMDFKNKEDITKIYGAYYSEKLITELNEMGIETCWVSVNDIDYNTIRKVFGEGAKNVEFILAIGYSKARNPFLQEPFSERLGVEDLVYDKVLNRHLDIDELERRGLGDIFFYIRFAPSIKNLQPWRFVLEDNKVELYVKFEEGNEPPLIDAGIIMYYFEMLALYLGIRNKWVLGDGVKEHKGEYYRYIGEYHL